MITQAQKDARVNRAKRHEMLDLLISGDYVNLGDEPKGCSVGCDYIDIKMESGTKIEDIDTGDYHAVVAAHDGTPVWLEHLRDRVFEGLPADRRAWWHVALAEALPVGVDLQPAYHQICIDILRRQLSHADQWVMDAYGNRVMDAYGNRVVAAIEQAIDYHRNPSESARSAAQSAAQSASKSAESAFSSAQSAAWSASKSAESDSKSAESAAWSAFSSAQSAAWSAFSSAQSAAWSASKSAESAAASAERAAWSAAKSAESAAEGAAWSAFNTQSAEYVWLAEAVINVLSKMER